MVPASLLEVFPSDILVDGLEVEEEAGDEIRGQPGWVMKARSGRSVIAISGCRRHARLSEKRYHADSLKRHPGNLLA